MRYNFTVMQDDVEVDCYAEFSPVITYRGSAGDPPEGMEWEIDGPIDAFFTEDNAAVPEDLIPYDLADQIESDDGVYELIMERL